MDFSLTHRRRLLGHFTYTAYYGNEDEAADPDLLDEMDLSGLTDPAEEFRALIDASRVIHSGKHVGHRWDDQQPVTYIRGEHPDWFRAFSRVIAQEGYHTVRLDFQMDDAEADELAERSLFSTFALMPEIERYMKRDGLWLRAVYLRYHNPDTQLVLECWDVREQREGTIVVDVLKTARTWGPETIASIVATNVWEPGGWDWDG